MEEFEALILSTLLWHCIEVLAKVQINYAVTLLYQLLLLLILHAIVVVSSYTV